MTHDHFTIVLAIIVGVVSTARITRLITWDVYPPMAWLRAQWIKLTNNGSWAVLANCQYCASPYVAAGVGAWGYFTNLQPAWWFINGTLAVAYAAAILVSADGDE